MFLVFYFCF